MHIIRRNLYKSARKITIYRVMWTQKYNKFYTNYVIPKKNLMYSITIINKNYMFSYKSKYRME